jgi:hypothetical protein
LNADFMLYFYIECAVWSKFNVFHVRALYHTKTLITNKCTNRVLSPVVRILHVSTLLDRLQGELSVTVTLGLDFTVE